MKINMKMRIFLATTISAGQFFFAATQVTAHQQDQHYALDAYVIKMANARVASGNPAGMVIATIHQGKRNVNGFGVASKAKPETPNASTVYEIGSITKTFTALLLADAVSRTQFKLNDPVELLLPNFKISAYGNQKITLLDLATQTSGLPRLPSNLLPKNINNPYADYHEKDLAAYLNNAQLTRAPGASYEYSNLGFGLLGVALSHQAKSSYEELLHSRITIPLKMPNTSIKLTPEMRANLAPGHNANGIAENWDFDAMAGAGAIRSNAQDMLNYLQAHMNATQSPAQTNKIDGAPLGLALTHEAQRLTDQADSQIGLAWHILHDKQHKLIWHNGATGAYTSFIGFTADGQHGVVILANGTIQVDDIGMSILRPYTRQPLPKELDLNQTQKEAYLGQYELAPGFILTVKNTNDGLYVQATGQPAAPIYASQTDEFFMKAADVKISFKRAADGKITGLVLHQAGRDMPARRMKNEETPAEKITIQLPAESLKKFIGTYALSPQFLLHITLENEQLFAQATGQGRNPIFASSQTEFFFKVVDAQLRFNVAPDGKVKGLVLIQGGQQMPASKQE
jgi:CubicO group peptidase (beta-lactamase class C family)